MKLIICWVGFAAALLAGDRRVFLTDSQSWQVVGTRGGLSGGSRPQNVELAKNFAEKCKGVIVTRDAERADFVVVFDHEGGKGAARKDNKIAVYAANGDLLHGSSTRTLGGAVKNACAVMTARAE